MRRGTPYRGAASLIAAMLAVGAMPAQAQAGKRPAGGKPAGGLSLDLGTLPADEGVTATGDPAVAPASVPTSALFTLDTPIVQLIADPRARAVLDRELPGLSDDENLRKFQSLGLRAFQPLTGGQLTDAMLARVGAGLAAIRSAPAGKGRNQAR